MRLKKIDYYLIRKFLVTFFFAIILFSFIATVIDLTEKIDDFIEKSVPLGEIVTGYYLNFLPYIDTLLTPLFVFISVIFFTSRMAYRSEIIAMLASGISFYRMLVPYLIAAGFVAALLFLANHYWVPLANKGRYAFEYTYLSGSHHNAERNFHAQIETNHYIYMENYQPKNMAGYKFSYEIIRDGKLEYKLRADKIEWDAQRQRWIIKNYYARRIGDNGEQITTGTLLDTVFNFHPEDITQKVNVKEEMPTPQLKQYIQTLRLRGASGIEFYLVELYRRTADAFMIFILTLIGVALSSRKVRGGSGLHLAAGVALSASFIVLTRFSTTFATNGNLSPFLSIWIPNLLYGLLAVYLIRAAPK
ncbi:MAG: membrane protein [Chitinophagales bacterium]|nr:MAG: membrane protein [Chitinophagales bacterium]